jgi:hypothetical protein
MLSGKNVTTNTAIQEIRIVLKVLGSIQIQGFHPDDEGLAIEGIDKPEDGLKVAGQANVIRDNREVPQFIH